MLRLDLDFEQGFVDLYNKFNSTTKGKEFLSLSGISRDKLDIAAMGKRFFFEHLGDLSVDPNANVGTNRNLNVFISETTKGMMRLDGYFLLWKYIKKIFGVDDANDLISRCLNGEYYPHDLTKISVPYCVAISTYNIMLFGRPYGSLMSSPPKRSSSFIAQCIEHVMTCSQEFAGAVALADLIINYAYFISKEIDGSIEKMNDPNLRKRIENEFQSFVHICNNQFRVGGDSPFSNISLYCRETLRNMFHDYRYPDGSSPLDIEDIIMEIQKIFMTFIAKKDPISGFPYRFPIMTVNLYVDKDTRKVCDTDFLETLAELNREGVFNIFITNDKARIASCCRMVNNKTDLMSFKGSDSFGNGGLNIGSHRVVTVNFPRIARLSREMESFKRNIKKSIEGAVKILVAHRELIKERIRQNFLQFFKPLEWLDLDGMFFSTIGVIGLYEAFSYLGIDLVQNYDKICDFLIEVNRYITDLANTFEIPINIEQVPGESAAINLAKKDNVYFGDHGHVLYSNQFIPLTKNVDLVTRMRVGGCLSRFFGGGVITHLNISSTASKKQMIDLITFAITCGLDHFALNMCFSKCKNDHLTFTTGDLCPECNEKIIEKVTRIVGYMSPVTNWVKERREFEFPLRVFSNSLELIGT